MKKLSLILTGVVLFGGLSFASPLVKQDKSKTEKKTEKEKQREREKTETAKGSGRTEGHGRGSRAGKNGHQIRLGVVGDLKGNQTR